MAAGRGPGITTEHHAADEEGVLRPDSPLNLLPLALYAAAVVVYAIHFAKRQPPSDARPRRSSCWASSPTRSSSGCRPWRSGTFRSPTRPRLCRPSSGCWRLSYLYLEVTTDERAMGVFIVPILVGLQTIPVIYPGVDYRDPVLDSPWFWVHVTSLLFAYATFALAAMLGLTYVLQFKEIKKKHLGYFYTRLPSLHVLDAMNSRAVAVGWLFLTIGVVVGVVWTAQALAQSPDNSNLRAMSLQDPKIFIAVLTWAVYSFAMFARKTLGWTGRRAAWLSAARLRDRVAQFPAGELLRHDEPHFPMKRKGQSVRSAGHPSRRKSSDCAGRVARAARLLESRSGRGRRGARAAAVRRRVGRAVDVQPFRDLRRQQRSRARARGSDSDS